MRTLCACINANGRVGDTQAARLRSWNAFGNVGAALLVCEVTTTTTISHCSSERTRTQRRTRNAYFVRSDTHTNTQKHTHAHTAITFHTQFTIWIYRCLNRMKFQPLNKYIPINLDQNCALGIHHFLSFIIFIWQFFGFSSKIRH